MDQNNQPVQPTTPSSPISANSMPTVENKEGRKVGPIIAILVVVLLLIIAALYIFASRINQQALPGDAMMESDSGAMMEQSVTPVTNNSDDIQSLQEDLDSATAGLEEQNF